jgi:hypothetical protein
MKLEDVVKELGTVEGLPTLKILKEYIDHA